MRAARHQIDVHHRYDNTRYHGWCGSERVDNITHSLFAVTLANAGLRRAGRGTTATLVIASNIPDIEVLTAFTGGRLAYLAAHRGPTHGPLALALALAAAAVVWLVQRIRGRRDGEARYRPSSRPR